MKSSANKRAQGFTLIEVLVVCAIMLVVAAMAIPYFQNMLRTYKLRIATTDAMGMVQLARMNAVKDARFYSVYYIGASPNQRYFVDIFPKNANGTSGTGGAAVTGADPVIVIPGEITPQPVGAAPNTAALHALFMPGSNVNAYDGFNAATPISFGAEGIPCLPQGVVGGSICNTRSNWMNPGAPVAYWMFFQHNVSLDWMAVTVTPAGKIQRWTYLNGAWGQGG